MTLQTGRRTLIGIGKESTRGTLVTPTYYLPTTDHTLAPKIDQITESGAAGRIEGVSYADVSQRHAEPSFSGAIRANSFPLLLLAALGSVSTTANSPVTGANTHAFSVANTNEHPSLSVISTDAALTQGAPYAMLTSLEVDVTTDNYAQFVASFQSRSPTVTTVSSPAIATESAFTPKKIALKIASDVAGLGSATVLPVISAKITIDKAVAAQYAVGNNEPDVLTNGTIAVSGEFQLRFEDATYQGFVLNGTKKALRLTLEDTDVTIGGSAHPLIELEMPSVAFSSYERGEGNDDLMTQTLEFVAEYSAVSGKMVSARVVNAVASY